MKGVNNLTWGEAKNFTWAELKTLQWCDIKDDKYTILQRYWNGEITLSPETEAKFKELCSPFADEYYRRYNKKINFKDFLTSASQCVALLRNLVALGEEFQQPVQELVQNIFDCLPK